VCLPKIEDLHFFYRVVALDLRGYGESDKPSGVSSYEEELLRDDIRDVIRALGRERCFLIGHDWGGKVAWNVAMFHPEVVEKLVILNCPHPAAFALKMRKSFRQFRKSW
jgi:pimeloyl-ACP methyl ester carboxylesterase